MTLITEDTVMSNASKVSEFLDKAKTFFFLTTDGDQPKGRPFGFHMLVDDKLYFGCGTFKKVFKQLTANPKVEVLAVNGGDFLRYDGTAKIVKDEALIAKVREAMPQIMAMYDKNGWEMGLFYLENSHAEIRGMLELKEEFDV
ncbi:MAG: pyridoxamine 5'-phosphate oxidase family protein [Ruminiclostridium sp.]|nr:pyridoxamine 5'-phosphate oxidase family protein [Ruminiclostridium sp.]